MRVVPPRPGAKTESSTGGAARFEVMGLGDAGAEADSAAYDSPRLVSNSLFLVLLRRTDRMKEIRFELLLALA